MGGNDARDSAAASLMDKADGASISTTARGVTSRLDIKVEIQCRPKGHGLAFEVTQSGKSQVIPARAEFVVHTLRNVVLGIDSTRLCLVEHLLAAASLWGLDDLLIKVDGPEIPLGDGSASIWTELFQKSGWEPKQVSASIDVTEPIICRNGDRVLMAIPDDGFSLSYHMDWNHPAIGKKWQSWDPAMPIGEIAGARTFGSKAEHDLLGITDESVSLTPEGFSQPLRFADEPVRHKLLDLMGDLTLSGVNPMAFKARFISIKAGHELDVEMAKRLSALIK